VLGLLRAEPARGLAQDLGALGEAPSSPVVERARGARQDELDRAIDFGTFRGATRGTLNELIERVLATYCGTLGVEYMHIPDREQRLWLQDRMEPTSNHPELSKDERLRILDGLTRAEGVEQFLQLRYPTQKRFSLEGAEALIPLLDLLADEAATLGVDEIVFGMPHRGRVNVLANILRKPYEMVLAEFEGSMLAREATGDGDVKYHLGYSHDRTTAAGQRIHLSLSANPSHLEAVDPVVEGVARAKQDHMADVERGRVVPVLMHGDAAFTGQGVVAETLTLSELDGYRTGGTIHIIVNNQIGFTTPPEAYRFTPYPSDVAKIIQAPVFHVNGDDPEAAVQAARLAIGFRQRFKKDVIIDLVCYRRHGHNELDDPTFTQPVMYEKIAKHPTAATLYRQRLVEEGVLTQDEATRKTAEFRELLDDAQGYARDFSPRQQIFVFGGLWKGLGWAADDWSANTAVAPEILREVAETFVHLPDDFNAHPKALKILEQRHQMVVEGKGIDWACAEALAIGSLLLEKTPVRFSGQDTARGTFSHRHAVLHDVRTGERYIPLDNIRGEQSQLVILDSMLSEYAVLGFEFGISMADPHRLVVWEAQFGDFANGAQIIIDQFLAASESKWQRMSGLVLLLPHGYEGQGPEHSSARLERFLQLCAEDNLQVCNFSTPAQYFHALRRQMHRNFRKPLVVMSPKSLLRHKAAVSTLDELTSGSFHPVLDDPATTGAPEAGITLERQQVKRVLLCSGKIYYALLAARRERRVQSVAIVRVEQLYPFPRAELEAIFASYPEARQVYWVQEEPQNMGAWLTTYPRLRRIVPESVTVDYVGRAEAASPAAGSYKVHGQEEAEIVNSALARA
jgi:2-oxoglutarate dehydrogenase E1 component